MNVIVNINKWVRVPMLSALLLIVSATSISPIVMARPIDEIAPFTELLARPIELRKELNGVHPRLFFTEASILAFRSKAKTSDGRELWQQVLSDIQTLRRPAPDPHDEDLYKSGLDKRKPGSISQYNMAFQIAETAFAYAVEQDPRYLAAAKKWTLAACEMPLWGYTYNKPNVDLPPAHLLYAVAFSYDLLYRELSPEERSIIREKLLKQGRLMYEYFKYKQGKRYTFSQNHTWIPMAGLAIAAYALMDEAPEVKAWAQLSRAVFDRTMLTFGTDGFFYESFHYLGFAFRWAIRYFDAHLAATGEDLYRPMRSKLAGIKYFAIHSVLPDSKNIFDIGDIGEGSLTRNGISTREKIYAEYDMIYRLAAVYQDTKAQGVADHLRKKTVLGTREPMWAFINRDQKVGSDPLEQISAYHHFTDNDTVFWRSDWSERATAIAFRSSPPEGHHAARLSPKIKDWRLNQGHAHPDANSFIIWAGGKYLTGDTGYLGIKQTDDHNTLLINGSGQQQDGRYEVFKDISQTRLDHIRISETHGGRDHFFVSGEASAAYAPELGVNTFRREMLYLAPGYFVIRDLVETEKPAGVTFMLNADRDIKIQQGRIDLINQDVTLGVFPLSGLTVKTEVVPQQVQARGLPGSVADGDMEVRGMQLRIATQDAARSTELINVMIPFPTASEIKPEVSRNADTITIKFPDGSKDLVFLTGLGEELETDSSLVVIKIDTAGKPVRAYVKNAATLTWRSRLLFASSQKRTGIFSTAE